MVMKIPVIISVFLLLLLIPVNLFSFNNDFYFSKFEENNLYEKFEEDINLEFERVLDYLVKGNNIEGEFFNSKEKEHLEDVRGLYIISWVLIIISLIVLVISYFILRKKEFLDSLRKGGIVTLVFIVVLGLLVLFDFNSVFTKFHEIFFSNNLWLLNPETDNLIKLLPINVFVDIMKRILLLSGVSSLVVLWLSNRIYK